LRKESPGLQPRGPVGRAQPAARSDKPAGSRDREPRARGRDDKVRSAAKPGTVLSFSYQITKNSD